MGKATVDNPEPSPRRCARCGKVISPGDGYRRGRETLCGDCCMDLRMTRPRKTHWQYLSCIRSQYLRRPEEG
ncbi:hypothetical protein AAU61_19165 [Desulfocarbo indianensis]|nr:hypothetical protein AAU61_19165 [Desulfocarbo indianensis]